MSTKDEKLLEALEEHSPAPEHMKWVLSSRTMGCGGPQGCQKVTQPRLISDGTRNPSTKSPVIKKVSEKAESEDDSKEE